MAERLGLKPKLICSGSRQQKYSEARSLVAWLAVEETGHPAAEVARFLGISRVGVKKAVGRGMQLKKQGLLNESVYKVTNVPSYEDVPEDPRKRIRVS